MDHPAREGAQALACVRAQLPEILDTLAASLRAGHGFDHGLQTVATDVGEPAGREFRRVIAEVHLGRSLEDALADLGQRIRSEDLQFVLDAIAIQRQVGGSLAELFELVATTVRAREQFRRNLRAITGQVRISANVLTGLPVVAAVLLTLVNPGLHEPALAHVERAHLGARCPRDGSLRLLRPSASRKGAVVTVLLLVLAALTLSASIFVAAGAVTASGRRRHSAVAVVRQWSAASGELRGDTSRGNDDSLIQRLGQRLLSEKLADALPQRLAAAGLAGRVTPQAYVVYGLLLVAAGVVAALLIAAISGQPFGATMLLAARSVIIAFTVPKPSARTPHRRHAVTEISNDLPDALDLLAVTVEAGVGLFGAIARLVECMNGALADEFSLVLTELRVGESSERALKRMAKRLDTPEVTSFVRSLLQGEQLGLSLGQTLRNLADDSRRRRRSLAEEAAAKAPIKMLFPAALFIFPALFIVILGPAIMELGKYL